MFYDKVQPPTRIWRPSLSQQDRQRLQAIYRNRSVQEPQIHNNILPINHLNESKTLYKAAPISEETRECLRKIREQGLQERFYAVVEVNTKPFSVTENDVIICKRLPGTQLGDRLHLTNVREVGSREYYIRGSPLVDQRYFKCEAVVVEQPLSDKFTKYMKRVGRGGGDRKFRKRSYRDRLTVLRVCRLEVTVDDDSNNN